MEASIFSSALVTERFLAEVRTTPFVAVEGTNNTPSHTAEGRSTVSISDDDFVSLRLTKE